jgi:hypothetical protein
MGRGLLCAEKPAPRVFAKMLEESMTESMHIRDGLVAAFALAALLVAAAGARAADYDVGSIHITQPWARATPKGASSGAGYLTVINTGSRPIV